MKHEAGSIKDYSGQYNLLTREFLKYSLSGGGNVMISPLSILLLLSIAADSTSGETREEILRVLGGKAGMNDPGRILSRFQGMLSGRDKVFSSANAVCVRNDFAGKVNRSYRNQALKQYDCELFSSVHMKRDINAWAEKRTNGMIREVAPDSVDTALLCLINAVAFEGAWAYPYDDEDVQDEYYHNADGTDSRVNMLFGREDIYLENEDFIGFTKRYKGENGFVYMALLPKREGSAALKEAAERIDFGRLFRSGRRAIVDTVMPEFRIEYSQELKPLCVALGMEEMFRESADFSPVSHEPLMLESILHKTFIDVNQAGTRAAAVSIGMVAPGCLPPKEIMEVHLDRLFVFAIVHGESGIPVYAGVVNHLEDAKADPERVKRNLVRNRARNDEALARKRAGLHSKEFQPQKR